MATLEKAEDLGSKALRFTILTACRTSEVLDSTWAEIDLVAGIWTIPVSRMKQGKSTGFAIEVPASVRGNGY